VSWMVRALSSSIGRKLIAGLTGLGLVGFLVGHLGGNLNLYRGSAEMNAYAEGLHHLPGFVFIEIGLAALFVAHIATVISLILKNKAARGGSGYAVSASKRRTGKAQSLASRMMSLSGLLLIVFIVVHLFDLRFAREAYTAADGTSTVGQYIVDLLANPLRGGLYVIGSLVVGWHVFHGFHSAFRSLGLNHDKYTPAIEKVAAGLSLVLALGFASLPLATMAGVIKADPDTEDAAATPQADSPADGEVAAQNEEH
jgi:succinate dehydrogenase / fumarate reductase cytochrome b subunit